MNAPPHWPVRWLERALHPDERQELIGDLTEQFQLRLQQYGRVRARLWFWRQAAMLVWGFSLQQRDVVSTNHERTRGWWLLQNAGTDWRYAWRSLWHSRSSSLVALLTLTLALGLSTTVFSIVNNLLLQPLPYPHADRLVRLAEALPDRSASGQLTAPVLPAAGGRLSDTATGQFLTQSTTLELVTPYSSGGKVVRTPGGSDLRPVVEVGAGFFELVGAAPRRGRLFAKADEQAGAAKVAVVSERFWREALNGRDDVAGTSLTIDDVAHEVVGVAAGEIRFPDPGADVWIAMSRRWPTPGVPRNFMTSLDVVARLTADATIDDAMRESRQLATRIAASDPAFLEGGDVPIPQYRVRHLQEDLVHPIRPALVALSAGMALVLLVAAANLMNMLLARSTARQREMAVRLTLGAARWRIIRPLLFEQVLLAGLGAAAGTVVAWALLRLAPAVAPEDLRRLMLVQLDGWALAFTAGVALVLSVIVGVLPAWQLPRVSLRDLTTANRSVVAGRIVSAESVRRGLVVVQVALAVVLIVGASLLGRTLWALSSVHPGYVGDGVLVFQLGLPDLLFREPERQNAFFDQLMQGLQRDPSVVHVGFTSTLPLHQVGLSGSISFEGRPRPATPADWPRSNKVAVSRGYLDAVGTRVIRGRGFVDADTVASEPVALIDQEVVERYFKGQEPLGQRIDFMRKMWRIVGVTESIKQRDVTRNADPVTYFPSTQVPAVLMFNRLTGGVAVRTAGDPMDMVATVRSVVRSIDPTVPVHGAQRLSDRLSDTFAGPRFYAVALVLFAALALVVALLGVYGVLSYAVERRRVEFGVRRALGGDERHILGLVLRQASLLIVVGTVVGLGLAGVGTQLLQSLLFGVGTTDATTYSATALGLWLVGMGAALVPALAAMRIDPARVLKAD